MERAANPSAAVAAKEVRPKPVRESLENLPMTPPPDLIRHTVTTGGFPREIGILIRHRAIAL